MKKLLKLAWSAWNLTTIEVIAAAEANVKVLRNKENKKPPLTPV